MTAGRSVRGPVLLIVLFALAVAVAGCATGSVPVPAGPAQRVEVTYTGSAVQGGVSRVPVGLGRQVQLVVHSDVADEVHVHGYDRKASVAAGGTAMVEFVADQAGVFEVELESRGTQIAQLEVR